MPTTLGETYLPTWRGIYPHMLQEDFPVWTRFLDLYGSQFLKFYYDVRVGGVYPGPEYGDEKYRQMYYYNTAKRIDALGEMEKEIWIIEVASRAGLRAMGQLLTYLPLWLDDIKIQKTARPVLVANVVDDDLRRSLEINGVLVRLIV